MISNFIYVFFPLFPAHCREALGMHSGSIPDEDITASSAYDLSSVGPHLGR